MNDIRDKKGRFVKGIKRGPHPEAVKRKQKLAAIKQHAEGRAYVRQKGEWHPSIKAKEKNRKSHLGRGGIKSSNWKGGKPKCIGCGKQLSNYGLKRCNSCSQIERWNIAGRKEYPRYVHLCKKPEYKKWRADVFQRDNWTCQTCGTRGVYLVAHHIKSWAKFEKLRFVVENGVTLCEECHKLTDNYKGKNI